MKHANSILETFEYFYQKSSKSITVILSYTVSKLVRFLRHSVEMRCKVQTAYCNFTAFFHCLRFL